MSEQLENACEDKRSMRKIWTTLYLIRDSLNHYGPINLATPLENYDKNKEGLVSYRDFFNFLFFDAKHVLGLSETQAKELADYFKTTDGRCMYKRFLRSLNLQEFETLSEPFSYGLTDCRKFYYPNELNEPEERQLSLVLDDIASRMNVRNIYLPAVFREYDLVIRNDGLMTIGQFSIALNFLGIKLKKEDFCLLVKKYIFYNHAVNTTLFAKEVEERTNALILEGRIRDYHGLEGSSMINVKPCFPPVPLDPLHDLLRQKAVQHPALRQISWDEKPVEIVKQIRLQVQTDRINLEQFFLPVDPLRRGTITAHQFKRTLGTCGLQDLLRLTENELKSLCELYSPFSDPLAVNYRQFLEDINIMKHADTCPIKCYHPTILELKQLTNIRGNYYPHISRTRKSICEQTLIKLQKFLKEKHLTLYKDFKREDDHNTGHVYRYVLRTALAEVNALHMLDHTELNSLDDRYIDLKGFDYRRFLKDLHEDVELTIPEDADATSTLFTGLPTTYGKKTSLLNLASKVEKVSSPEEVISKLKLQVRQLKVLLSNFLPKYNRLKGSVMPSEAVWRALCAAGFKLNPREFDVIKNIFAMPFHSNVIDVNRLVETIYSVDFELGLERTPHVVPLPGITVLDDRYNNLTPKETSAIEIAMYKLSTKAEFFLPETFRVFDKYNIGVVEKHNFPRALSYFGRNIEHLLTAAERDLVYKAFCRTHGDTSVHGIDYFALCDAIKATKSLHPI